MEIISQTTTVNDLKRMAAGMFISLVKAVVDVRRGIIAVDAELHSDLEAGLLADGSKQEDIWGINFYPDKQGDDFIEFDSMINVRPSCNNLSRGVDSQETRRKIMDVVSKRIMR
ncbi:MAG: DUF5674 family protein [Candidatus Omnitrophica bacterium]|nr:DUF5674 family protein [Candidatus Omnitrophota bacterium]MDD5574947.1 DUF5674 family protein [Candidatus Omnitrophota bacterium]